MVELCMRVEDKIFVRKFNSLQEKNHLKIEIFRQKMASSGVIGVKNSIEFFFLPLAKKFAA